MIFVYNVDASPLALMRDLYQAVTVGETDCRLCDITYGKLLKDPEWARFVRELPVAAEFRMRSTFVRNHPDTKGRRFPAAYLENGEGLREVIGADEMEAVGGLADLMSLVSDRVRELGIATSASPAASRSA